LSKQDNLVEAAKKLLWDKGYESMSPRAIMEQSGAGQGSLYHHFRGKADLAATALGIIKRELKMEFDSMVNINQSPMRKIEAYLKHPRESLKGCRLGRLTQENIMEDDRLRVPIALYFEYIQQELESLLRQAQSEGEIINSINTIDLAVTLIAIVQGGYVLARALQDPKQMDQAIQGSLYLLKNIEYSN
jgi:AcrR family transcriptional regulator